MRAHSILDPGRPGARVIAFHLPQFHPIAENDRWWGKGFTEWTNVTKAQPLFRGHHQPRLPADLGYYDLRLPEARAAQAELAVRYGIEGFCYWHYWFHGKRLLERPVEEILATGEPDFPFCLAWANESWTRNWLGSDHDRDVLIEQCYSEEDDRAHARWLAQAFADPRYIRINGRPMLLVYKPTALPNARQTTDIFRKECVRLGLAEPYIVGIDAHAPRTDMRTLGFDMTEHHEPMLGVLGPDAFQERPLRSKLKRNLKEGVLVPHSRFFSTRKPRMRWLLFGRRTLIFHVVSSDGITPPGEVGRQWSCAGPRPSSSRDNFRWSSTPYRTNRPRNVWSSSTPGTSGQRECTSSRTRSSAMDICTYSRRCSGNTSESTCRSVRPPCPTGQRPEGCPVSHERHERGSGRSAKGPSALQRSMHQLVGC